ncbi:hypothetical protein EGW08_015791 [Elysia chlorotica]|uniref:BEN domain-containing protein n=1 Tax=Elysia chlorotica TaxID=188477 RepID=A0A3S0ZJU5_ELYCH|nr:hypothetical protein EGW08_015791 [Elysia chlorotica]
MAKRRKGPNTVADLRGKQRSGNRTPETTLKLIREHILSQTGPQGGVTQASPGERVLNAQKLYNHYHAECQADDIKPASISMYRKVLSQIYKDKNLVLFELPEELDLPTSSRKKPDPVEAKSGAVDHSLDHQAENFEENFASGLENSLSACSFGANSSSRHNQASTSLTAKSDQSQTFLQGLSLQNSNNEQYKMICEQSFGHRKQKAHSQTFQTDQFENTHHSYLSQPSTSDSHFDFTQSNDKNSTKNPFQLQEAPPKMSYPVFPPQSISSAHSLFKNTFYQPESLYPMSDQVTTMYKSVTENLSKSHTTNKKRKSKNEMSKKEVVKRSRNEESWLCNIRKRLRLKGEAYTSVRGKPVEAKLVKEVDCSKCLFTCTSKIDESQRIVLNKMYWELDTYEKKINYLSEYVETYSPKKQTTGRKAFSRRYFFAVNGVKVRVCKDFFLSTLHISESTIATALKKTRNGPDSIADMRGRHKAGKKSPEDTLQNIRELIIYLTGFRPHKPANNLMVKMKPELFDVNRLYQIYKYDCEKNGRKAAKVAIFQGVLTKDFCIKKKMIVEKSNNQSNAIDGTKTTGTDINNKGLSNVSHVDTNHAKTMVGSESLAESFPLSMSTFMTGQLQEKTQI